MPNVTISYHVEILIALDRASSMFLFFKERRESDAVWRAEQLRKILAPHILSYKVIRTEESEPYSEIVKSWDYTK